MTIEAKIIADSRAESGVRLTTFVLKYPRFIHSEFMTHRMFSRNASSSRAIPFKRQMKDILNDMAMPISFRANKKGMQAGGELAGWKQEAAIRLWKVMGYTAVNGARLMSKLGAHKQYVNRLVEPFSHISVVCTGTEDAYANFFALRYHSAAQPEIKRLAELMWEKYRNSMPNELTKGQWHLPFLPREDQSAVDPDINVQRSVARCARVSYNNHDGSRPTVEQDLKLFNRLLGEHPLHASPAEHVAMACDKSRAYSGNFRGWVQYRKMLPEEYITKFTEPLG